MDANKKKEESKIIEKPTLLKAIELVLANPANIKKDALKLLNKYEEKYSGKKSSKQIRDLAAKQVISNYSYFTSFIGGASALVGIIPGLGQVIAAFGGAAADATLCMKYQIEITMALGVIYGHDIENEEEGRLCLIIAGLGTINQAAKEGGKKISSKAFQNVVKQYIKGATLKAVKEIFKKVGIIFTRKALEKSIPFGVGVIIGSSANKALTTYVGNKAKKFFSLEE